MKFLVQAFAAKRGFVLGVKVFGRTATACRPRPNFRGDLLLWRIFCSVFGHKCVTKQGGTCTLVHICAWDRVACLERRRRDSRSDNDALAGAALLSLLETVSAKEDKELYRLPGKTPRLFLRGMCGIAVQS